MKTNPLKLNFEMEKIKQSKVECSMCEGQGKLIMSCCGYNLFFSDVKQCPDCKEHCDEETEKCEECDGEGFYILDSSIAKKIKIELLNE